MTAQRVSAYVMLRTLVLFLLINYFGDKGIEAREVEDNDELEDSVLSAMLRFRRSVEAGSVNFEEARKLLAEPNSLYALGSQFADDYNGIAFSIAGQGIISLTGFGFVPGIIGAIGAFKSLGPLFDEESRSLGISIGSLSESMTEDNNMTNHFAPQNFFALSLPARILFSPKDEELRAKAEKSDPIFTKIRGQINVGKDIDIRIVKTNEASAVRVIAAQVDEKTGMYVARLSNSPVLNARFVTAPKDVDEAKTDSPLIKELTDYGVGLSSSYNSGQSHTLVNAYSEFDVSANNDAIIVYPVDSGLEPAFIVFNTPSRASQVGIESTTRTPYKADGFPALIPRKPEPSKDVVLTLKERSTNMFGEMVYTWYDAASDLRDFSLC